MEAKIGRVNNFNIRQLFYPYKDWSLKSTKEIIPIFFIYTNGLFYFIQFKFGDQYGDLTVTKSMCYTIDEAKKQQVNLGELIESSMVGSEPDVPYPQANDLDKIIDLVINNKQGLVDKITISDFFDFDERQGDYYANAAIYLGLLSRKPGNSEFILTKEGQYISTLKNRNKRNYFLLQQMLNRPTFNEVIQSVYNNHNKIDALNSDSIAQIIQKHINISATTAKRRASTVMNWIRWINSNIEFN